MNNVTLVGGAKAGNFTDLGYATDMEDCKQRYIYIFLFLVTSEDSFQWTSIFLIMIFNYDS